MLSSFNVRHIHSDLNERHSILSFKTQDTHIHVLKRDSFFLCFKVKHMLSSFNIGHILSIASRLGL